MSHRCCHPFVSSSGGRSGNAHRGYREPSAFSAARCLKRLCSGVAKATHEKPVRTSQKRGKLFVNNVRDHLGLLLRNFVVENFPAKISCMHRSTQEHKALSDVLKETPSKVELLHWLTSIIDDRSFQRPRTCALSG